MPHGLDSGVEPLRVDIRLGLTPKGWYIQPADGDEIGPLERNRDVVDYIRGLAASANPDGEPGKARAMAAAGDAPGTHPGWHKQPPATQAQPQGKTRK